MDCAFFPIIVACSHCLLGWRGGSKREMWLYDAFQASKVDYDEELPLPLFAGSTRGSAEEEGATTVQLLMWTCKLASKVRR